MLRYSGEQEIELPGGYVIERNTSVTLYAKQLFYHPDYWHKPETFNPDRFLDPKSRGLHF